MSMTRDLSIVTNKICLFVKKNFAEMISEWRRGRGLSVRAAGEELGVSRTAISNYERGSLPEPDKIPRIALALGVSQEELTGSMRSSQGERVERQGGMVDRDEVNQKRPKPGETVYLPLVAVRASAGNGNAHIEEHVDRKVAYDRVELYREIRANPNDMFAMVVEGDSMIPTLRPGTMIIVKRAEVLDNFTDGVYVFRLEEAVYVKAIQRLPGRRLRIMSYNDFYPPFEVELGEGLDFELIGKVVLFPERL